MSRFYEVVTDSTPRFVVVFKYDLNGNEMFQWGVVGQIPVLSLIGCITRLQGLIGGAVESNGEDHLCPEPALCVTWDEEKREFDWFLHPTIPIDPLLGMLDTVKTAFIHSRMAQHAASQRVILGPDGQPMR